MGRRSQRQKSYKKHRGTSQSHNYKNQNSKSNLFHDNTYMGNASSEGVAAIAKEVFGGDYYVCGKPAAKRVP